MNRGEETLIGRHTSHDGCLGAFQDNVTLEEGEPRRGGGTEDGCSVSVLAIRDGLSSTKDIRKLTTAVEGHATSPSEVMLLETSPVNGLLGQSISATEQHLSRVSQDECDSNSKQ